MKYKFKVLLGDSEIGEAWVPDEKPPVQFVFHYGENKVIPFEWLYKWENKNQAPFHHNIPQVIEEWEKENGRSE